MDKQQEFMSIRTIVLNGNQPSPIIISIDGKNEAKENYSYTNILVHSFVWNCIGYEGKEQTIEVIPYGDEVSLELFNNGFEYVSPEEVNYSYVKIPMGAQGEFTYYYTEQSNVYEEIEQTQPDRVVLDFIEGDMYINESDEINDEEYQIDQAVSISLSDKYFEVFSIRVEPNPKYLLDGETINPNFYYIELEGVRIDCSDLNIRTYYEPDVYAGNFLLGSKMIAYIYGLTWSGSIGEEEEDDYEESLS